MKNLRQTSGKNFADSLLRSIFNITKLGIVLFGLLMAFLGHMLLLKLFLKLPFNNTPYIFLIYASTVLGFVFFCSIRDLYSKTKSSKTTLVFAYILGLLNYAVCGFYGQINRLASDFAGDTWFQILTYSYSS